MRPVGIDAGFARAPITYGFEQYGTLRVTGYLPALDGKGILRKQSFYHGVPIKMYICPQGWAVICAIAK